MAQKLTKVAETTTLATTDTLIVVDESAQNPDGSTGALKRIPKSSTGFAFPNDITSAINTEVSNRNTAISNAIDTEVTNRNNAIDEALSTKADAIIKSASGEVASFSDGGNGLLVKSLNVNITPKQSGSGDPSPSNVRPISGVDTVDIVRSGGNLFDGVLESGSISTATGREFVDASACRTDYLPIKPSSTIYYQKKTSNYGFYICTYGKDKSFKRFIDGNGYGATLTTNADEYYIRARFNNTPATLEAEEIVVSYGTTRKTYITPNGEPESKSISLGQTVYGGVLDVVSGNGTKTYHFHQFNGYESSVTELGTYWGWVGASDITPFGASNNPADGVCSHFKFGTDCIVGLNASSGAYFLIYKTALPSISTLEEFKSWVANQRTNGTPLTVCYKLATPTQTFSTTPTEVKTLLGNNNIWGDSGSVEVEYRADTTLVYNELLSLIASLS